jgi:hypothetical protein
MTRYKCSFDLLKFFLEIFSFQMTVFAVSSGHLLHLIEWRAKKSVMFLFELYQSEETYAIVSFTPTQQTTVSQQ